MTLLAFSPIIADPKLWKGKISKQLIPHLQNFANFSVFRKNSISNIKLHSLYVTLKVNQQ